MAESQRFELWKVLPPCWFSRPVLSTAQPTLLKFAVSIRVVIHYILVIILSKYKDIFIIKIYL